MRSIESTIDIGAPAEQVWSVFTDFESYPDWNPFIRRIEGETEVGAELEVDLARSETKSMTFKPKVLHVEPGRRFTWLGRFLLPRLMDGQHSFGIEPTGDGVRFTQSEEFRGALVPFMGGLFRETEQHFAEMNEALKERVESS